MHAILIALSALVTFLSIVSGFAYEILKPPSGEIFLGYRPFAGGTDLRSF